MPDQTGASGTAAPARPTGAAMRRGLRGRCPACGAGRMFCGYLKVRPACPDCGQDLSHQRADDGLAYFTILIVGHLMAPILLWVYPTFRPEPWVMIVIFSIGVILLSLVLLPRIKGAMIGLQWAWRMHGFGGQDPTAARRRP